MRTSTVRLTEKIHSYCSLCGSVRTFYDKKAAEIYAELHNCSDGSKTYSWESKNL